MALLMDGCSGLGQKDFSQRLLFFCNLHMGAVKAPLCNGGVKRVARPMRGITSYEAGPGSRRPSRNEAVTSGNIAEAVVCSRSYSTGGSSAPAHSE